ncbi:hypothetical protein Tco_0035011, partial [Tanacetum coccineum]
GLEFGRYDISSEMDTTYQRFLGVGTTFDIFQNILLLYIEYDVLISSGYGVLVFVPSLSFVKYRHRYAISSLMDTAYRVSEQELLPLRRFFKDDKKEHLEGVYMQQQIKEMIEQTNATLGKLLLLPQLFWELFGN